jgi:hypothetical protein
LAGVRVGGEMLRKEMHKQKAVTSPLKGLHGGSVTKRNGTATVTNKKGSNAAGPIVAPRPSWVPDKNATDCYLCAVSFSIMNRRVPMRTPARLRFDFANEE